MFFFRLKIFCYWVYVVGIIVMVIMMVPITLLGQKLGFVRKEAV